MHLFIFQPGIWLGQGTITLSASPEKIGFYTKWEINTGSDSVTKAIQLVEMEGTKDHLVNIFEISEVLGDSFGIQIENEFIEKVPGKGIFDGQTIGWEFGGNGGLKGVETYRLQSNGEYEFHAEYVAADGHKTTIDGLIWRK